MQQVFVVWDNGVATDNPYKNVNRALNRGANVVFVTSAAPSETGPASANSRTEAGRTWAVSVFVIEGTEEQLAN